MLFVAAPAGETWEFEDYLKSPLGNGLAGRMKILTCDEIVAQGRAPLGSYIFEAIDQMSPTEKEIMAQCWERLREAGPGITLINHPFEVVLRYDMLKDSFERKRNGFRVRRAAAFLGCRKFPVFLRRELDHNASLTPLLHTRRALARAIAASLCRGYRLRDLIVIEYCGTADASGMFRKYSAFIVGGTVLPHSVMHGKNWIVKSHGRVIDAGTAREETEYVRNNPHAGWLRETFAQAKTRYGRIDYGLLGGKPQVWEINTNPTIARHAGMDPLSDEKRRLRQPVREEFFPNFQMALEAIDSQADPGESIPISVSPGQRRELEIEKKLRLRVRERKTAISWCARRVARSLRRIGLPV